MTTKPITTMQFIGGTALISIGFVCLMATQGKPIFLFTFPVLVAHLFVMSSDECRRPLTRSQLLVALGVVFATAAVIWWAAAHRTPEFDSWGRSFIDSFSHPIVAVPLWLGLLFLGYRRWRMKPPLKDGTTHERE